MVMGRAFLCLGVSVACFWLPGYVEDHGVVGTKVPCSDEMEYVQPEDEWSSGANPDCPSHWEAWNSLPPTTN